MNDYIIETHDLTKKYGSQTSVSHLNIHVKKGRIYGPVSYTHLVAAICLMLNTFAQRSYPGPLPAASFA